MKKIASTSAPPKTELKIISAASASKWEAWLDKNHLKSSGVWLRLFKKSSGVETIARADALDLAICHGWIDGQAKPFDAESWLQKFTPRRSKSIWSKINTQHVARLAKAGKMKAAGLAAVATAKKDGRWKAAYDSPKNATIPSDFLKELARDKKAEKFFATLNRTNLYSIAWRLQTAIKSETRARRMKSILEMLSRGEKFH